MGLYSIIGWPDASMEIIATESAVFRIMSRINCLFSK
jgi:hypothetical protein